jgi:hypothetical protein
MNSQQRKYFTKPMLTIALSSAVLLLTVLAWWAQSTYVWREAYVSFTRPDGRYKVLVTRNKAWTALMPGQTGDSPGVVWLLDKEDNPLYWTDVEMVQLVEHVDWQDKRVSIKLIADWDLPD